MDVQITINATPEEARAELARFLDSGEYPQATGTLCRHNDDGTEGYCCLGVASEIGAALGLVDKTVSVQGGVWFVSYGRGDGTHDEATLGPVLCEFFGMSATGLFDDAGTTGELTNLNDHMGFTFPQIAAVVRQASFLRSKVRR